MGMGYEAKIFYKGGGAQGSGHGHGRSHALAAQMKQLLRKNYLRSRVPAASKCWNAFANTLRCDNHSSYLDLPSIAREDNRTAEEGNVGVK